jgi:hypothetical protein
MVRAPALPRQRMQTNRGDGGGQAQPARTAKTLGRNDPCWCGSGKKYKNCHLRADQGREPAAAGASPPPARAPARPVAGPAAPRNQPADRGRPGKRR